LEFAIARFLTSSGPSRDLHTNLRRPQTRRGIESETAMRTVCGWVLMTVPKT
jgi:hypothetical protein